MELTYQTIIRLNLCAWPPKSINNLHFIDYYLSTVEEIDRRCSCGPLSGRRNFDRRSDGARVRASVESTVKRPKRIHSIEQKSTDRQTRLEKAKHNRFHDGPPAWIERKFTFLLRLF